MLLSLKTEVKENKRDRDRERDHWSVISVSCEERRRRNLHLVDP